MELIPADLTSLYLVFTLATLLCCMTVQVRAVRDSEINFTGLGWTMYLSVTGFMIALFAPVFFYIFIFDSHRYYLRTLRVLTKQNVDTDE